VTGTGTWELPQPTVVVIDAAGVVAFAEVSPDWLVRTEADAIIGVVKALKTLTPRPQVSLAV
jgi:peroxiredoxin